MREVGEDFYVDLQFERPAVEMLQVVGHGRTWAVSDLVDLGVCTMRVPYFILVHVTRTDAIFQGGNGSVPIWSVERFYRANEKCTAKNPIL